MANTFSQHCTCHFIWILLFSFKLDRKKRKEIALKCIRVLHYSCVMFCTAKQAIQLAYFLWTEHRLALIGSFYIMSLQNGRETLQILRKIAANLCCQKCSVLTEIFQTWIQNRSYSGASDWWSEHFQGLAHSFLLARKDVMCYHLCKTAGYRTWITSITSWQTIFLSLLVR